MYRLIPKVNRVNHDRYAEYIEEEDLGLFDQRSMGLHGVNRNLQRDIALFFDNLKPVQRRILYTMALMGLWSNKEYDSCAGVVGETLKRFHPHGDGSAYKALIYLRQPWRALLPLVDIDGNYGNADNSDAFAQMRYVKCRMSAFAEDCFFSEWNLKSPLVDMKPSYDGKNMEPIYLPAKYPLFLTSWGSGMGYGIATRSPGFLPQEAFETVIKLIDDPKADFALYPEDPLGCSIVNSKVFKTFVDYKPGPEDTNLIYKVRSTYSVRDNIIIVHNTPYEVNPATVVARIQDLVKKNRIDGLNDIETELKRGPIPQLGNLEDTADIYIELKKGYDPHIMMEKLYKLTDLEVSVPLNCVYVDTNKNVKYNLRDSILKWIHMRKKVLKRLYRTELNRYQQRINVLDAVIMLFDTNQIERAVQIIRGTHKADVSEVLINEFNISYYQACEIGSMRLTDLATDSYSDFKKEYASNIAKIQELQGILSNKSNINRIIQKQMQEGIKKYSRKRLSAIIDGDKNADVDDTLYSVCITSNGYIKKMDDNSLIFGKMAEADIILAEQDIHGQSRVILFDSSGRVYGEKISKISKSKTDGVGYRIRKLPINNIDIVGAVVVQPDTSNTIISITRSGIIKRSKADDYFSAAFGSFGVRVNGKSDSLVGVVQCCNDDSVAIFTNSGKCIIYKVSAINITARVTSGVIGIALDDDEVIGIAVVKSNTNQLITISSKGELKRFSIEATFNGMKRGYNGVDVVSRDEAIFDIVAIGPKDKTLIIITSKSPDGEIIQISDIPLRTRISSGDKLLSARSTRQLVKTGV